MAEEGSVQRQEGVVRSGPRLATVKDLPRLAWITSLDSAKGSGTIVRTLWAAACYAGQWVGLRRLIRSGQVWHADRELLLLVMPAGKAAASSGFLPWGIAAGALVLIFVLSVVDPDLGKLAQGLLGMFAFILFLPTFLAMPLLFSRRTREAGAAVKTWTASSDEAAYNIACLTKNPRVPWGEGLPFAKDVLTKAVPPGTRIAAIAFKQKEVRYLKALGFAALENNGRPSYGMARRT